MHKAIFNFVTYGKGGWSWETVYNLPIYLRNFYFHELEEALDRERQAIIEAKTKPKKKAKP